LLAYWTIAKSTDPGRAVGSNPANYNDLLHLLLLSRGIDPATVALKGAARPARPNVSNHSPAPVAVHGGARTSAHVAAARSWSAVHLPRDWSKRTGSDPAAIRWAMESD